MNAKCTAKCQGCSMNNKHVSCPHTVQASEGAKHRNKSWQTKKKQKTLILPQEVKEGFKEEMTFELDFKIHQVDKGIPGRECKQRKCGKVQLVYCILMSSWLQWGDRWEVRLETLIGDQIIERPWMSFKYKRKEVSPPYLPCSSPQKGNFHLLKSHFQALVGPCWLTGRPTMC